MKTSLSQIQKSLNELASTLEKCTENKEFTAIERDILLAKTRQVYEGILSMEVAQAAPVVEEPQPVAVQEPAKVVEVAPEPIAEVKQEPIVEQEPEPVVEAKPEPIAEPEQAVKEELTFIIEEPTAPEVSEPAKPVEQVAAPVQKAEEPKQEAPVFSQVTDLGSKLAQKPIKDIYSALTINERYLYRSQLFNNNQDFFMKSINTLNESKDFNTALGFIKSNFSWDFENKNVQNFMSIVERRFM